MLAREGDTKKVSARRGVSAGRARAKKDNSKGEASAVSAGRARAKRTTAKVRRGRSARARARASAKARARARARVRAGRYIEGKVRDGRCLQVYFQIFYSGPQLSTSPPQWVE